MTTVDVRTRYEHAIAALFARRPEIMLPGLRRIEALCHSLGAPERTFPAIHLTGTNGKTSTARMVTALLTTDGRRTGTYTSPHLQDVRERFRIDGTPLGIADLMVGLDTLAPHIARVEEATGEMVSFFEASTALCLWAFARAGIDTGVVEVGMGGRWDATNVVDGRVAVIGRVALDHPELGATVADVAWEKAGIVKRGATVISTNVDGPAAHVVAAECAERGAQLLLVDRDFGVLARTPTHAGQQVVLSGVDGVAHAVDLPLHGAHQATNAACALAAAQVRGVQLAVPALRDAFAAVRSPGRLELRTADGVPVLLDGAHNPAAMTALVEALSELTIRRRRVLVLGALADKDIGAMTTTIAPAVDEVIVTAPATPRAAATEHLAAACTDAGLEVVAIVEDAADAVGAATSRAGDDGMVIVTGSLYVVGDARAALGGAVA